MKKLFTALCITGALTLAAGAADVGTIGNSFPGDTEAQAQMLYDLGLFRGTEQGFALEKPMTRAEAAVMLTRLLGAEQAALVENRQHPFGDVPQWAAPYVGWLYQNGLARGVSDAAYGADENVTCVQYCTFLARAAADGDDYRPVLSLGETEVTACDRAGFVRGDAVSLSARLLGAYYTKGEDASGVTVAQKLIDKGVFTKEQLKAAAWDVLPRSYARQSLHGADDNDYRLSCVIAGVPVVRGEQSEAVVLYTDKALNGLYGESQQDGQYVLYQIDPETVRLTALGAYAEGSAAGLVGRAGQTDYLWLHDSADGRTTLYAVRGSAMQAKLELPADASVGSWQGKNGCVLQSGGAFYRLAEDEVLPLAIAAGEELFAVTEGGLLVTQNVGREQTTVSAWRWDGEAAGSYTVYNDYIVPAEQQAYGEQLLLHYAPRLTGSDQAYLYGGAGLYREQDGLLVQVSAQPAYAYAADETDGSIVIITHDAGRRVEYTESAVSFLTGDTLARVSADGTVTRLLPTLSAGSLLLGQIEDARDGAVRFTLLKATEPRMMGRFRCTLRDGRVTVDSASDDILYIWGENAVYKEQERLGGLGLGA